MGKGRQTLVFSTMRLFIFKMTDLCNDPLITGSSSVHICALICGLLFDCLYTYIYVLYKVFHHIYIYIINDVYHSICL